jgi:hypothetical protein
LIFLSPSVGPTIPPHDRAAPCGRLFEHAVDVQQEGDVVARLADPTIHLAAYGGIVFPLALLIESPIIMLLAASTALSKDWASFLRIRRFMMVTSASLTALHLLVVLTPLYDLVVRGLLNSPAEIIAPARVGMLIMTPWTWSIAYRRFHQGVLIRFGHSHHVTIGTFIRLTADVLVLAVGYLINSIPGIIVATSAVSLGVLSEAVYIGLVVRPVLKHQLRPAAPIDPPLTLAQFLRFYIPLVMTALISMLAQPLGSAGIGRMPRALESLAVWPVAGGLIFVVRSLGVAYNEVVVALLDEPGAYRCLRRFALQLSTVTTLLWVLLVATPLAEFWFTRLSALSDELATMARQTAWLALPLPALAVLQSWFQGQILHSQRTRGITEAVIAYMIVNVLVLGLGIVLGRVSGIFIALAAMVTGSLIQAIWLWLQSRQVSAAGYQLAAQGVPNPGDPVD